MFYCTVKYKIQLNSSFGLCLNQVFNLDTGLFNRLGVNLNLTLNQRWVAWLGLWYFTITIIPSTNLTKRRQTRMVLGHS